jgi:23S rRNA (pseudouridine1915-N3)-methyltransferase
LRTTLIAVGKNMPDWVKMGFQEYNKRLPAEFYLHLVEIAAGKRLKGTDTARLIQQEGKLMLEAIPKQSTIIALEVQGQSLNTLDLAKRLQTWRDEQQSLSLLIGGPDGLAPDCLARAHFKWSLSPLTLPHPLVRVIIAEQFYRAFSIISHHPYHR